MLSMAEMKKFEYAIIYWHRQRTRRRGINNKKIEEVKENEIKKLKGKKIKIKERK